MIAAANDDDTTECCAACGKGGDGLKKCNACKEVSYCSKECQKLDWRGHRAECKQRQAELLEEALFNTPCAIGEDCPICFLPLGEDQEKYSYQMCCGKRLCLACLFSIGEDQTDVPPQQRHVPACPFCRAPGSFRDKEVMRRLEKRIAVNDVQAFTFLAGMYQHGIVGVAKDTKKAMELYARGIELGSAECHAHVGGAYHTGWAGMRDLEKAKYHYKQASVGGRVKARMNLAVVERNTGNESIALKHFLIAAKAGCDKSLQQVQSAFLRGHVSKDEYASALRSHQKWKDEMRSPHRDKSNKTYAVRRAQMEKDGITPSLEMAPGV